MDDEAVNELTRRDILKGATIMAASTALSGTVAAQSNETNNVNVANGAPVQPISFLWGTVDKNPNEISALQPDGEFFARKKLYAYVYQRPDGTQYIITQDDNQWRRLMQNKDYADRQSANSVFGQQLAQNRVVQAQNNFLFSLSEDVVTETTNSGTVGVSNAKAFAQTGINSGTASVNDRNRVRYRTGTEAGMLFTAGFPETSSSAQLQAGMFDESNGYYVGHDGSYFVGRLNDGTETKVYQSEWDDPLDGSGSSGETQPLSGLNVYRISFGYLGSAPVSFETLTDSGWVQFHQLSFVNTDANPHIQVPTLPPQIKATSSGATNARIECASWMGYTLADTNPDPQDRHWSEYGERTSGLTSGEREHVLTVRVKDTYQGQDNHVSLQPISVQNFADAGEYTILRVWRNATFSTALSYQDVNTAASVSEYSDDDVTVSDGRLIEAIPMATTGQGNSVTPSENTGPLPSERILPGETITIDAITNGTPNAFVSSLSWSELF